MINSPHTEEIKKALEGVPKNIMIEEDMESDTENMAPTQCCSYTRVCVMEYDSENMAPTQCCSYTRVCVAKVSFVCCSAWCEVKNTKAQLNQWSLLLYLDSLFPHKELIQLGDKYLMYTSAKATDSLFPHERVNPAR
jgi:hypothetical protein